MGLRVLIVDDSQAMRAYVRRTLQISGLQLAAVHEAADGQEAESVVNREYAGGNWIDLIFTDLNMPNVNGEDFVKNLRSKPEYREIPILIVSTDATQARVVRLRELGAQGYVSKPCPPELIKIKVEQVIGRTNVPTS